MMRSRSCPSGWSGWRSCCTEGELVVVILNVQHTAVFREAIDEAEIAALPQRRIRATQVEPERLVGRSLDVKLDLFAIGEPHVQRNSSSAVRNSSREVLRLPAIDRQQVGAGNDPQILRRSIPPQPR